MVEFSSDDIWSWAFLCWEVFDYHSVFLVVIICSDFFFLHDSVLVGCMFLGIYPSVLGYLISWCIIVHGSLLPWNNPFISVTSVVISPLSFLILVIWNFSLFFLVRFANSLSIFHWCFSFCISILYFISPLIFIICFLVTVLPVKKDFNFLFLLSKEEFLL